MSRRKVSETADPFSGLRGGDSLRELTGDGLWSGVDAEKLQAVVVAVIARGDALVLGGTQDGGAMALTVLSQGARRRFFEHDTAEIEAVMDDIIEWAKKGPK